MHPTTISTKKKILLIILAFLVIALIVFFITLLRGGESGIKEGEEISPRVGDEGYLTEIPGLPKSEWKREIDIQKTNGSQTVTNPYDGYRITVPNDWVVNENVAGGLGGLSIAYGQEDEHGSEEEGVQHIHDGLVVNIFVFENLEKLTLNRWLGRADEFGSFFKGAHFTQVQNTSYDVFQTEAPLLEDRFVNNRIEEVPIEDTLSVKYVIKDSDINTVYALVCTIYNSVDRFVPECENIVPGFEILSR